MASQQQQQQQIDSAAKALEIYNPIDESQIKHQNDIEKKNANCSCFTKILIPIGLFYFLIWPRILPIACPLEISRTNIVELHYNWTIYLKAHLTFEETIIGDLHLPVAYVLNELVEFHDESLDFIELIRWSNYYNTFQWEYLGQNKSLIVINDFNSIYHHDYATKNCTVELEVKRKQPNVAHLTISPGRYRCQEKPDFMSLTIDRFELRNSRFRQISGL